MTEPADFEIEFTEQVEVPPDLNEESGLWFPPEPPRDSEMIKHTKGPFTVDQVVSDGEFDVILGYEVPGEGSPILVGSSLGGDGHISDQEAHANAMLFAASPDMADALAPVAREIEQNINFMRNSGVKDIQRVGVTLTVAEARAVLAAVEKAGGKIS